MAQKIYVGQQVEVGEETKSVARAVPALYVEAPTEVPVYGPGEETAVMTSANVGEWFTYSDPDNIGTWSGTSLTVKGIYSNDSVKLTALTDMEVSFSYDCQSFCKVSVGGLYIDDDGESGSYSGTLRAGKNIHFYISNAATQRTGTLTDITCTRAITVQTGTELKPRARKVLSGYVGVPTEFSLSDTTTLASDNIASWFTVTDSAGVSSWSDTSFNASKKTTSTHTVTLTAIKAMDISFDWNVSSAAYVNIKVNGISTGASSSGSSTGTYTGSLAIGDIIELYLGGTTTTTRRATMSNIVCTSQRWTEIRSVARKFFTADVPDPTVYVTWNKYACTQKSTEKKTYTKVSNTSTTRTIYFGPEAQIESKYTLYSSYTWSSSVGYSGSGGKGFYTEFAGDAVGYYDISTSGSYEYLWEVTSATDGSDAVKQTRIGTTKYTTETVYSYSQGSLIGTVQAPEDEYPEDLTYVAGSLSGSYIVLKDGSGTYYYYTKA